MGNVPTVSWSEATPAGTSSVREGDDRIRELKKQVREMVGVDHDYPSSGQASDNGQHLQVTLQEQANLGTGAVNATILGSQTVSGKGELVYTDEDDNDVQLTKGGTIVGSHQTDQAVGSTSNPTTASVSYVDLEEMSITMTTGANPVLVTYSGTFTNNTSGAGVYIIVDIDGTDKAESERWVKKADAGAQVVIATSWLETVTAASHTWKIQWKVGAGIGTADTTLRAMQVIEFR